MRNPINCYKYVLCPRIYYCVPVFTVLCPRIYPVFTRQEKTVALFKDDGLVSFLADYGTVKASYPAYSSDQVLAQLWDQGGYSWVAVPDEG